MCRRQPGRRCHRHCEEKLAAAQAVLIDLQLGGSFDQEAVNAAADRVAEVATEMDATGRGRQQLRTAIAQLEGHHGADVDLHREELAARLVAAEALVDERRRQQRHMPPSQPAGDVEQVRLVRAIGKSRGELARTQVQMLLSRDSPTDLQRWVNRHRDAAMAALDLHTHLRTRQAGGAPATGFLSQSEQRVWRRGGSDRAVTVALSHRRAVIHDHPDAFDTVVPLGTREARATGEVYRGAEPVPVEDLYSGSDGEARDDGEVDASQDDPVDAVEDGDSGRKGDEEEASDGDAGEDEGPADNEPGRTPKRAGQRASNATGRAVVDQKKKRKAERQQHRNVQQRAGQRRKKEIREVRGMIQRVDRLAAKADQGQGKGIECGGILMLDYFQINLG